MVLKWLCVWLSKEKTKAYYRQLLSEVVKYLNVTKHCKLWFTNKFYGLRVFKSWDKFNINVKYWQWVALYLISKNYTVYSIYLNVDERVCCNLLFFLLRSRGSYSMLSYELELFDSSLFERFHQVVILWKNQLCVFKSVLTRRRLLY